MNLSLALTLMALTQAGTSPDADTASPLTVMVLELEAEGVEAAIAATGTAHVAKVVSEHAGLRVLTQNEIRQVLDVERTKQILTCEQDTACIAELADPGAADLLIVGSVGRIGKSYLISLSLIDMAATDPKARAGDTFSDLEDLPTVIESTLARLFKWDGASQAPSFALPKGKESSFVVLDFNAAGIEEGAGKNLTQVLTNQIKAVEGARVINRDDVVSLIGMERMKSILEADCDVSCLVKIGDALNTDYVVLGQVGKLAGTYLVTLTLVDQTVREVGASHRVSESFRGSADELIRAVRFAARRLLSVSSDAEGSLQVGSPVTEAKVFVDGVEAGVTPMPPLRGYGGGRYSVRLARDGYLDWQSDVYVDPGRTTAIWAEPEQVPQSWYEKWWVWAIVGAAAAGGATAAVVATQRTPETGSGTVRVE